MLFGRNKQESSVHAYYYKDGSGLFKKKTLTIHKNRVYKNGDYQNQWTIPCDSTKFGMRVTIRWMDNNSNLCEVSLVTGGGNQNGLSGTDFRVLESGIFNSRATQLLDMAAQRIVDLEAKQ